MQKLMKINALKNYLRPTILWLVVIAWATLLCPNAYSQVGKESGDLPAGETGFRNFSKSHKKDRLTAFIHVGNAKRMPQRLAVRHHYSPMLMRTSKNNPDSLIRVALLQDRTLETSRLYQARLPGTAGNPKPPPPAGDANGDKSGRETEPPMLDEYIRNPGLKKKQ
jgi:hypothetical protein